ncbi:MAG: cytochrome C [Sneathiella sp.]|nr:cytochrome c [Sneathiella sp.]MAZ04359.1 cytochrome C [Sneathiella sp.]
MSRKRIWAALALLVLIGGGYYLLTAGTGGEGGSGAPMVSVTVPELTAAARFGKGAFDTNCASCHGVNAAGQDGIAPPLVHKIYEPNHHGDVSFWRAAKTGVRAHHWPFGDMPPVEAVTDEDLAAIVLYIRELQRANGIN